MLVGANALALPTITASNVKRESFMVLEAGAAILVQGLDTVVGRGHALVLELVFEIPLVTAFLAR